ncbi:hypothetical protein GY45DRAFT_1097176 [Cubamyces sp. BRFM 1775]|nr:hypothetical protein GY45DRAFT_1097176 [Cubamyces sp. BRFM 1775]
MASIASLLTRMVSYARLLLPASHFEGALVQLSYRSCLARTCKCDIVSWFTKSWRVISACIISHALMTFACVLTVMVAARFDDRYPQKKPFRLSCQVPRYHLATMCDPTCVTADDVQFKLEAGNPVYSSPLPFCYGYR